MIEGKYLREKKDRELVASLPCTTETPCHTDPHIRIWHHEEKQTDVNIAAHVIQDAWLDQYEQAAIISNDSDLEAAFSMARCAVPGKPRKQIVLLTPSARDGRKPAKSLTRHSDQTIQIGKRVLQVSQMPDNIPGTTLYRPAEWT